MMRGSNGDLENISASMESELESLLRARRNRGTIGPERDLNMFRGGSAPPTVEGSLTAVGNLLRDPNLVQIGNSFGSGASSSANGVLSEEEIRSHPAYLSYYYSHENLNPRLPPPLLTKEDWRVAQRFQAGGSSVGGIGDLRKNIVDDGGGSLFCTQPGGMAVNRAEDELMELRKAAVRNLSRKNSFEFLDRGSDGLNLGPRDGMRLRRRSFADILQEGLQQPVSLYSRLAHPANRSSFSEIADARSIFTPDSSELCNRTASTDCLYPGTAIAGQSRVQSHGSLANHSLASTGFSFHPRNRTPETHLIGRSSSPSLTPVGSRNSLVENKFDGSNALSHSCSMIELPDLSSLSLSKRDDLLQSQLPKRFDKQSSTAFDMPNGFRHSLQQQCLDKSRGEKLPFTTNYVDSSNRLVTDLNGGNLGLNEQANFPRRTLSSTNLHSKLHSSGVVGLESSTIHFSADNHPHMDFACHTGYINSQKSKTVGHNQLDKAATFSTTGNGPKLRSNNQPVSDFPVTDPGYIQYLQRLSDYATHAAAFGHRPQRGNGSGPFLGYEDLESLQRAYLDAFMAQQKQQYESLLIGKSGSLNQQYYGNPSLGPAIRYQGNPMANIVHSVITGSPLLQKDQIYGYISTLRSPIGEPSMSWHPEGVNVKQSLTESLLEEVKNSKNRSFELSDVVDHVVEFSTDQYGSRFIQQKLETATAEEKKNIFPKIIPNALSLMTDVFGNYVIQKFFEYGTKSERKELANQLIGHVLPLSLQMYGCRVIQKALEVVDVDQKIKMVAELDGSVMKCVRDQNGNHVIQKCIECVPQDRIQFIVSSFIGEVVPLSIHPYGCRVIQRVLEHCDEPNKRKIIMDEIMNSVCTLAQDQYGNYVIQHVVQHGKPRERSLIIEKLVGQIVKMSQQKFASNVVEKCLTFGSSEERQLLVNEILGSTDENEPLQVMMKDPFGNYVVQKVLETCDDHSRELILSRIKVHLNALKRYTYGKHIVSRVEKLVTAGERHMASLLSSHSS